MKFKPRIKLNRMKGILAKEGFVPSLVTINILLCCSHSPQETDGCSILTYNQVQIFFFQFPHLSTCAVKTSGSVW